MPRPKVPNRSVVGKRLQARIDAEDRLRARKVPEGMMGSAWGYNRPKSPSLLSRIGSAWTEAVKQARLRRNPPPQIEGALDISDIDPRVSKRRTSA